MQRVRTPFDDLQPKSLATPCWFGGSTTAAPTRFAALPGMANLVPLGDQGADHQEHEDQNCEFHEQRILLSPLFVGSGGKPYFLRCPHAAR